MRSASTTLAGLPRSVPTARHWIVMTLRGCGLPETAWAAEVMSELAASGGPAARCSARDQAA